MAKKGAISCARLAITGTLPVEEDRSSEGFLQGYVTRRADDNTEAKRIKPSSRRMLAGVDKVTRQPPAQAIGLPEGPTKPVQKACAVPQWVELVRRHQACYFPFEDLTEKRVPMTG